MIVPVERGDPWAVYSAFRMPIAERAPDLVNGSDAGFLNPALATVSFWSSRSEVPTERNHSFGRI